LALAQIGKRVIARGAGSYSGAFCRVGVGGLLLQAQKKMAGLSIEVPASW
jgi:hypothetical protein